MPEFAVAVRVTSDSLDPEHVTRVVGVQPSAFHRMGESHVGRDGRSYGSHDSGLWYLESRLPRSVELAGHLRSLFSVLGEGGVEAIAQLARSGYDVVVAVGVFDLEGNEEVVVPPDVVALVGRLNAEVVLDLYTS